MNEALEEWRAARQAIFDASLGATSRDMWTRLSNAEHALMGYANAAQPRVLVYITEGQYPFLYRVFDMISHDSGSGAGHIFYTLEDTEAAYSEYVLCDYEASLKVLENYDLQTFAIGEQGEAEKIALRDPVLGRVHKMLDEWFEAQELRT